MIPHPDTQNVVLNCAVITVSDTRTPETDKSGQLIQQLVTNEGHKITTYAIVKDEPAEIQQWLIKLDTDPDLHLIIFSGGTGIAPRDTTFDVVDAWLTKSIPGFGEIFRHLSYQEIGSRAIASRAVAGVKNHKLIFSLPGSVNAVKLAVSQLILPEVNHLFQQIQGKK